MSSARVVRGKREEEKGKRTVSNPHASYLVPLPSRRSRGFTLLEAMAAVVLLGIGIVGAMSANAQVIRNEDRARLTERMQRLAQTKLAELVATGQASTSTDGDFTDQNQPGVTWNLEVNSSGITNLNNATLTVQESGSANSYRLDTVLFVPPETTATTTGATG